MNDQIVVVGDWVVAGEGEGLDVGQIMSLDGDLAEIAWGTLQRSKVDITG